MADSTHTPGPWRLSRTRRYVMDRWGAPWVCEVTARPEFEANARLLVAAPDLKQALAGLLDMFGGYNCPEVDAAITAMQKVGEDRWSMQSQMVARAEASS